MKRPSHATIVAYLALFTALSGSAYAAATINSANIKDRSIRARDIKKNTITGTQINERALQSRPRLYRRTVIARPAPTFFNAIARCNPGDLAVSGSGGGATRTLLLRGDGPLQKDAWFADFDGNSGVTGGESPSATVVCARKPRR